MTTRPSLPAFLLALLAAALLVVACGEAGTDGTTPPDECEGAKCDAMNRYNDPANLGFTIKYELADEAMVGVTLTSDLIPYSPPGYFPFTGDGINKRKNGKSPAERYDLAFSGWNPPEEFWSYKKLEGTYGGREFDQEYYDHLGPVATWEHHEHGLGRLHNGVDDDGDGKTDFDDDDNEGLESWFGYCNGNTAATLSVPEPLHAVTYNNVEFAPYDIMALMAAVYYSDRSTMTGLRCESLHPAKDKWGRYVDQPYYRKPGAEDLTFYEIEQGPMWIDETKEHVGYLVAVLEQEAPKKAMIRLTYEEFKQYRKDPKAGEITFDNETWEPVEFSAAGRGCRDTNPATIYLAVTNILGKYKVPFGIDADAGSHVWNYPIYEARIDEQRVIDKAEANRLLEVPEEDDYPFNPDAVNFAYAKLSLLRSHGMTLTMVLEMDENNKVLGGEYTGSSRTRHPDFIWMAKGADDTGYNTNGTYVTFGDDQKDGHDRGDGTVEYTDAPGMSYSTVRKLLAMSRTSETETFQELDGEATDLPPGETTELTVTFEGEGPHVVSDVLVYFDIEAQFTAGLKIELESPDGTKVNLFDIPYNNQNWQPGNFPKGWDLGIIKGVAHPMPLVDDEGNVYEGLKAFRGRSAIGPWKLRITHQEGGSAQVKGWSLWLTSKVDNSG